MCSFGERQGESEKKARLYLEQVLQEHGINYIVQTYSTTIPNFQNATLIADGKVIPCAANGLVSGDIDGKEHLVSSLLSSEIRESNINFNPYALGISRADHYFAPALAIAPRDVSKVMRAKEVKGKLQVKKTKHTSANLLVGNLKNPNTILFSHYDSIETGAVDNASGTALSLELILSNPNLLETHLFALCGSEELVYDDVYWGYGYRVFEKKYQKLLEEAKKLLVLDSFGFAPPCVHKTESILRLGFPIKELGQYVKKTAMISGDLEGLMRFYHSKQDTPDKIKSIYLQETYELVLRLLAGHK